jgi:thiamine biosynthesis protein ThiS
VENSIRIRVNGESRDCDPGTSLIALVRSLGLEPDRLAIELNRGIVKRDLWDATIVPAESEIEIVQFVGGG